MSATPVKDVSPDQRGLPGYNAELALYHLAFAPEIAAAIKQLPLRTGARVLDVPCGDGFYTKLLAERVGDLGCVTGADLLPAYLRQSREVVAEANLEATTDFVRANAYRLPFDDGAFDAVWCAQSFISLNAPLSALREFQRVLKPGGFVAVLESDDFHHLLLPWPGGLEVRLQAALQAACAARYGDATKTYVSRQLRPWMKGAGFDPVRRTSQTADRESPLTATTRRFLDLHLPEFAAFIEAHLSAADRELLQRLAQPDSPEYLPRRDDFDFTCLFTVWCGNKP